MNPYSIGVGVFVKHPQTNRVLVGRRGPKCARGAGCLALPGGKVDPGETIVQCVLREVKDETDLAVELSGGPPPDPRRHGPHYYQPPFRVPGLLAVTDHLDPQQQLDGDLLPHLSLWVMTLYAGGEPFPVEREKGKCDWWQWMSLPEIAAFRGVNDPTHPQYYWTPMPLWRHILRPYFGEF